MALPFIIGGAVALYFINKFMPAKTDTSRPTRPLAPSVAANEGIAANNTGKSYSDARYRESPKADETIQLDQPNNPPSPISAGSLVYDDNNNASTLSEPVMADEFNGATTIAVPLIGD
jgi:hypothetical protein